MKIKKSLLLATSLFLSANIQAQSASEVEPVSLAPQSSHMSVFNSYCLEDLSYFNIGAKLSRDGWISDKDIDRIKNPHYKELFSLYAETIKGEGDKSEITIYTRELNTGVVFVSIHPTQSGCSIMPLDNYTADEALGFLADRNVSTHLMSENKTGDSVTSFHLYGRKVIAVVESPNDGDYMTHMFASDIKTDRVVK